MSHALLICSLLLTSAPAKPDTVHVAFADRDDDALLAMVKAKPSLITDVDDYECTALHYAARYGRVETARWLIDHEADVNTVAYNKFTPMHVVTSGAVADLLIKAGAKLSVQDAWGKTPLQSAAYEGRKEVCEVILASGYAIDLSSALWLGKRDLAKQMIRQMPELVTQVPKDHDLWGNTSPLGIAAGQGDNEIVSLLLAAGAPVNAATERPLRGAMTALTNAVRAGHYDTAVILCKAGADCNVTAGRYRTLLDFAQKHSDKKMIELLIKYGARGTEAE